MNERYDSFSSSGRTRNLYTARTRRIALPALSLITLAATCAFAQQPAIRAQVDERRAISVYRENFYAHNKLERYGLPPGNPKHNPDGSLDVYLQADSPGPDKEANWLPTPKSGMFNATLRMYNPKPESFDPLSWSGDLRMMAHTNYLR